MRQIEPDPTAVNRLMMGPDGVVHVIPTGTRKSSPTPREMEGQPTAAQQASESGSADLPPSYRDAARQALRDVRRAPTGGICFSYSAAMPPSDRDAARLALRDVRRAPEGGICFSY